MADPTSNSSAWLPAALTSIGSFITAGVGFLAVRWSDARKDERTYRREKAARDEVRRDRIIERRNEFQRQTLLELQEAMRRMVQASANYLCSSWTSDTWNSRKGELRDAMGQGFAETTKFATRIRDAETREPLSALKKQLLLAEDISDYGQRNLAFWEIAPITTQLENRIGHVLRQLDEIELAD